MLADFFKNLERSTQLPGKPAARNNSEVQVEKLAQVVTDAKTLVDEIRHTAEGLDPNLLLEVVFLTDADFSEPVDGETLLAQLRSEGLL